MAHLSSSSMIGRTVAVLVLAVGLQGCASFSADEGHATTAPAGSGPPLVQPTAADDSHAPNAPIPESTDKTQPAEPPPIPSETAKVEPKPTKPVFELRGRIQAEAALVSQSNRDSTIIGPVEDAVGFRRARLGAQGNVGESVRWVAEFDFAGGSIAFKDVYVAVTNLPFVREVRVGNFCEPFTLDGATSSNNITFVERSSADVFDPARHWGVGAFSYTDDERATFQAGVFRSGSNNTGNDVSDQRDVQYTARATALPWCDADTADGPSFWHIGAAFSQQYANNNTITYNQGPQSTLLTTADNPGSPFQPSITIAASQQQLYNLQTALVLGPLTFQGVHSQKVAPFWD